MNTPGPTDSVKRPESGRTGEVLQGNPTRPRRDHIVVAVEECVISGVDERQPPTLGAHDVRGQFLGVVACGVDAGACELRCRQVDRGP